MPHNSLNVSHLRLILKLLSTNKNYGRDSLISQFGVSNGKNSLGSIVSALTIVLEEKHMEMLTYFLIHAIGTVIIADILDLIPG